MNLKFEATVLIPTYNRPDLLDKLIHYINLEFSLGKVRFIVLDGSNCDEALKNKELCLKRDLEYYHYDNDISMFQRLFQGLNLVQTEFVSILADDDLLNPQGFYQSVDFLKGHPDYTVAHGDYVDFTLSKRKIKFNFCYKMFSIEQDLALDRLFCYLSRYQPIFYGVFRTSALLNAFREIIIEIKRDDFLFFELLESCIPIVLGKVKKINCFYYGRQLTENTPRKVVPIAKRVFIEDFTERYTRVKKSLMHYLESRDDILQKADDAVDFCFSSYFGKYCMNKRVVSKAYRSLNLSNPGSLGEVPQPSTTKKISGKLKKSIIWIINFPYQFRKKLNIIKYLQIKKALKIYYNKS